MHIDQHLTWKDHIKYISAKVAKKCGYITWHFIRAPLFYPFKTILLSNLSLPIILLHGLGIYLCIKVA